MGIYSFSPFGFEGALVNIEVDLRRGIPAVDIVGLSDGCVKETRERMRAAIRNSCLEFPPERVLISLSPADLKKEGAGFDLPIALAVLERQKELNFEKNILVMGELELSGNVRPVRATLAACSTAITAGIEYAILPKGSNVPEGIKVCEVETLNEALDALGNLDNFKYADNSTDGFSKETEPLFDDDMPSLDEVKGHDGLKYAMAVAVAGRHSLLTYGAPGCGKTMVLQHLPQLMPRLTKEEAISVSRIYSIAGLMKPNENYIQRRPFRMPHQTASIEGICGGGANCRPGEITLAHNGVLFLDEAAEFRCSVLQMLRVPLETNTITLSRAGRTTVFPAKFQLFMASNPCPCGNYGNSDKICLCSAKSVDLYWKKFSAPLLDRIQIRFDAVNGETEGNSYSLEELREFIAKAWKVQYERQGKLNQDLSPAEYENFIKLDVHAEHHLTRFAEANGLSPRSIKNVCLLARTLMDIHQPYEELINDVALCEALRLHGKLPVEVI
jgi:magnesium chelatase family protein